MDYVVVVTSRLKLRTERALIAGRLKRDDFLKEKLFSGQIRIKLKWLILLYIIMEQKMN